MKNYEIVNANEALGSLKDHKVHGRLKFKLFRNKRACENAVDLLFKTLEGVEDESERSEILEEEQDIDVVKFTLDELDTLPLSMSDIAHLEAIIEFEGEE